MNEIFTDLPIHALAELRIDTCLMVLLGFGLGYVIRGPGIRRRIDAARAEGAMLARTSIDGAPSLSIQIDELSRERDWLQSRIEVLTARSAARSIMSRDDDQSAGAARSALTAPTAKLDSDIVPSDPSHHADALAVDTTAVPSITSTQVEVSKDEAGKAECDRSGDKPLTKVVPETDGPAQGAEVEVADLAQSDHEPLLLTQPIAKVHETAEAPPSTHTASPNETKHSFFQRRQSSLESEGEDCCSSNAINGDPALRRALAERINRKPSTDIVPRYQTSFHGDAPPMSTQTEAPTAIGAKVPAHEPAMIGGTPDELPTPSTEAMPHAVDSSDCKPQPQFKREPATASEPGAAGGTEMPPKAIPVHRPDGRALFARRSGQPGRKKSPTTHKTA